MKKLEFWGAILTVAYLALMGWWLSVNWTAFLCLELNELGDFLAGTFGPVAFLWLVLGFLQQGRELKLSTNALRLQAEELKNSVQQQTEMNRIQALGLANQERLFDPLFEIRHLGDYFHQGDFFERFEIENSGGYCDCVSVVFVSGGEPQHPMQLEPLNTGTVRVFSVDADMGHSEIHLSYRTRNDTRGCRFFDLQKWHDDDGDEGYTARQRPLP
ncbi:hypothetical protein [Pseudomonas syringae]|uniref:hypothetical protein n=1 Tax=Pseudomonas syringae TaxID=317 RepID=UPI00073FA827|nr:hypothetical protein [Pseudomonas syringae]